MVARDVTERLELQRAQMREERMSVVGKLAAGLAHEINNPLGAIALFTQHALRSVEPDAVLADHLRTVQRNAEHCKRIVRDLLTYARQRPPERVPIDVSDVIAVAARTLQPQADQSRVTLEVDATPGALRRIDGDPDQLRQVLINLGLNAIEAMPGGGALHFVAREEAGGVRIEVRDTGPGIPAEQRDRVFSAFFTTKPEGTGLGLAVARDIVQAHQGEIALESDAASGTRFSIRLPAARRAEEAA
jgi:signal transduction histidine kinase